MSFYDIIELESQKEYLSHVILLLSWKKYQNICAIIIMICRIHLNQCQAYNFKNFCSLILRRKYKDSVYTVNLMFLSQPTCSALSEVLVDCMLDFTFVTVFVTEIKEQL